MSRIGTKEWKVLRADGEVILAMNEETAAGLALIVEMFEESRIKNTAPVTWTDLVAELRTAR